LSGKIPEHRFDCERLGTKPLALERFGDWISEEHWRDEVDESVRHLAGNETRPEFEMEQRLPDDPHSVISLFPSTARATNCWPPRMSAGGTNAKITENKGASHGQFS
jgi:hypothetical protein